MLDEALFTAPAHPQWGGAALIGADGKLLGIGSLLVQEKVDASTLQGNMIVPIDILAPILDDMVKLGRPNRPSRRRQLPARRRRARSARPSRAARPARRGPGPGDSRVRTWGSFSRVRPDLSVTGSSPRGHRLFPPRCGPSTASALGEHAP